MRSAGTFERIFSFDGGKKWIIRLGGNGISVGGVRSTDGERTEEVFGWTHHR